MRAPEKTTCTRKAAAHAGECVGESCETARGSLTHFLSIWSGPSVRGSVLVFGPEPEFMSCFELFQTGLVPDFQLAFDWCVAIPIGYKEGLIQFSVVC